MSDLEDVGPVSWSVDPRGEKVRVTVRARRDDRVLLLVDLSVEQAKGIAAGMQDVAEQVVASALGVREDQPEGK